MYPFTEQILNKIEGPRSEMLANIHARHETPQARYAATKVNYAALLRQALAKDHPSQVFAANTYSGTLVTSFLMDGSVTDLQNVWAFLNAFSLAKDVDPYKPLAVGELK